MNPFTVFKMACAILLNQIESIKASDAKLFNKVGAITAAVMEAIILVVVVIMINEYVVGNQSIINTTASTIAATVVPILQAALLIAAILGSIGIIYFAATHTFSTGK